MKIFLDVGGHFGETAKIALEPKYNFDKIYTFEPVPECCEVIKKINDPRVEICEFGLWNKSCTKKIYNPISKGASVYEDKFRDKVNFQNVEFKSASEWFLLNIKTDDRVYLKLNCEGSEIVILDDLIASGEYRKIDVLMTDFDVRKIPSQKHKMDSMKQKVRSLNIPKVFFIDEFKLGRGTHSYFTHYWLDNS